MATIEEEPTTLLGYFIMALKVKRACLMCPWICGSATLLLVAAAISTCRPCHVVAVFYRGPHFSDLEYIHCFIHRSSIPVNGGGISFDSIGMHSFHGL
jgi:hypothetical protein